jgi:hypothetical protein
MATIIEALRTYISTYAPLDDAFPVHVDYLPNQTSSYSIDPVPGTTVIEQYMDGSSLRRYLFVLSSREPYGEDVLQNLTNSSFYEDFAEWLETNTKAGTFPVLESDKAPQRILASGLGYILEEGTDTARYQIQCSIEYEQKGA